jgi:hypothetical protein
VQLHRIGTMGCFGGHAVTERGRCSKDDQLSRSGEPDEGARRSAALLLLFLDQCT